MLPDILSPTQLLQWMKLVRSAHKVVIIGHHGPDGDAVGSCLGLAAYLHRLGKLPRIIMPNAFPDFLGWLPRAEHILNYDRHTTLIKELLLECDLICCLDFNAMSRIECLAPLVKASTAPLIMIDHHENPEDFATLTISEPHACATSEIVFRLIWQLGGYDSLTADATTALYCGMMTDTGGFTYNSNNPDVFFIISKMLEKGIDKDGIYKRVFHNYSLHRIRLMGYILNEKLALLAQDRASLFTLTRDEMTQFEYIRGDSEGFINLPLTIKNVELSISLREDTERPLIRVSLRSESTFPCNKMAAEFFNGGGHYNASGGTLHCSMDEAIDIVHRAVAAYEHLLP